MKINVFSINKNDPLKSAQEDYAKLCKGLGAKLDLIEIFTSNIAKAQKSTPKVAQKSYTESLLPHLGAHNYALHPQGKILDSYDFARLLLDKIEINFFIGGAYGFDDEFLSHTLPISLSPLTFSHQIAKLILCEQIYRGLSINANHPYHK